MLGFESYADIAARLDDVAAGRQLTAHAPRPPPAAPIAPAARQAAAPEVAVPGHGWLPTSTTRTRLSIGPGRLPEVGFGLRSPLLLLRDPLLPGFLRVSPARRSCSAEAEWLASTGARELVLVSENSTSYGKDLGDLRTLERLLPQLAAIEGIDRIRVSYLQPAELRAVAARDDRASRRASRPTSTCPSSTPAPPYCAG